MWRLGTHILQHSDIYCMLQDARFIAASVQFRRQEGDLLSMSYQARDIPVHLRHTHIGKTAEFQSET